MTTLDAAVRSIVGGVVGKSNFVVDALWMTWGETSTLSLLPGEIAEGSCGEGNILESHLMNSPTPEKKTARGYPGP